MNYLKSHTQQFIAKYSSFYDAFTNYSLASSLTLKFHTDPMITKMSRLYENHFSDNSSFAWCQLTKHIHFGALTMHATMHVAVIFFRKQRKKKNKLKAKHARHTFRRRMPNLTETSSFQPKIP